MWVRFIPVVVVLLDSFRKYVVNFDPPSPPPTHTLQLEYQRYLEEMSPRWNQQLKEHTQRAEKKVPELPLSPSAKHVLRL